METCLEKIAAAYKILILIHRLLNWIQSKIPDLPITNFTTDWNDGKAVGALVDAVAPGKMTVFAPSNNSIIFCANFSFQF